VLSIVLWHFYHVHLKHFNKSIFTGRLTEEEMHAEHPAELAYLHQQASSPLPPARLLRRRRQIFLPIAILLAAAAAFGLYKFVTLETTAVTIAPQGETAPIFVPQTPTPTVAPALTPTAAAPAAAAPATWTGGVADLLAQRCAACHGPSATSGLSLTSYSSALQGGTRGPAIVPGDPQASVLVQVQSAGAHPGQLTSDELAVIIAWIESGAPEN